MLLAILTCHYDRCETWVVELTICPLLSIVTSKYEAESMFRFIFRAIYGLLFLRKDLLMNNNGYPPRQPYHHEPVKPSYPEPTAFAPDPSYSGVYGPYVTEREKALEHQVAIAEGKAKALQEQSRRLQRELEENRRRLIRWQLNIRTSIIAFLSIFIVTWATVSVLVQYPVLPWNMPSAILHLLGH